MAKILLVEDEINIASFIERGLKEFGHSVSVCHDGDTGWKILQDEPFDLLILDIIMPKINGLELCHLYRQMFGYQTPVIMLTANDLEIDQVTGFSLGADDYITKPFSLMILRARVERMLARMAQDKGLTYEKDGYRFVFEQMYFTVEGQEVTLSKTEQKLLRILIEHQGQTLTREQLVDRIWSDGAQ